MSRFGSSLFDVGRSARSSAPARGDQAYLLREVDRGKRGNQRLVFTLLPPPGRRFSRFPAQTQTRAPQASRSSDRFATPSNPAPPKDECRRFAFSSLPTPVLIYRAGTAAVDRIQFCNSLPANPREIPALMEEFWKPELPALSQLRAPSAEALSSFLSPDIAPDLFRRRGFALC